MTDPLFPSDADPRDAEIARCDAEIAEILTRPDVVTGQVPAWLVTLGVEDWEAEKRVLLRKARAV